MFSADLSWSRFVSRNLRLSTLLASCFALCPLLLGQVSETQVTTLTKANYSTTNFWHDGSTNSGRGFLFTTDGQSYTLDTITIEMQKLVSGNLRAYLSVWSGADPFGIPIEFTYSSIGSSMSMITFTPESAVRLEADATYAMYLTVPTSGTFSMQTVTDAAYFDTPAGNAWILPSGALTSSDGGGSWSQIGSGAARLSVSVQATSAVPEPSTYAALAGLTIFGFVLLRRRRA